MKPLVKSMAPISPLFYQEKGIENISSVITEAKFTCVYVLYISSSVSVGAEKCCSV
jgi:hypothetical protein